MFSHCASGERGGGLLWCSLGSGTTPTSPHRCSVTKLCPVWLWSPISKYWSTDRWLGQRVPRVYNSNRRFFFGGLVFFAARRLCSWFSPLPTVPSCLLPSDQQISSRFTSMLTCVQKIYTTQSYLPWPFCSTVLEYLVPEAWHLSEGWNQTQIIVHSTPPVNTVQLCHMMGWLAQNTNQLTITRWSDRKLARREAMLGTLCKTLYTVMVMIVS